MDLLKNRPLAIFCLLGGALSLITSYYVKEPLALILSSLLFFFSIVVFRFGYLISPAITNAAKLSIRDGDYELLPDQKVLIKKTDAGYFATMFLSITLRHTSAFKSAEQKAALADMFERAVSALNYTLKICLVVCNLSLADYTDKIEERRSLAEQRKSQLGKNSADFAVLEREIKSYNSQLKRLCTGERPMQVLAYAQTSAFGLTKEEVSSRVRSQALESAAVLSNALSCEVRELAGSDLLRCAQWEKISPSSKSQIEDELF